MANTTVMSLAAVLAMMPITIAGLQPDKQRDGRFWLFLAVAVAGPLGLLMARLVGGWHGDFATTLWVTVVAGMAVFATLSLTVADAWRLAPLATGYLAVIGILAAVWPNPESAAATLNTGAWIWVHIAVSVVTYGLVTIAAVAALAAVLQERALKAKRPTAFTRGLPAVSACDRILVVVLAFAAAILALGLLSGIAINVSTTGSVLFFDHKTVLTLATFAILVGLLVAHFKIGLRGRRAARYVLLAYLLLSLGYPGVKFVTEVLLA